MPHPRKRRIKSLVNRVEELSGRTIPDSELAVTASFNNFFAWFRDGLYGVRPDITFLNGENTLLPSSDNLDGVVDEQTDNVPTGSDGLVQHYWMGHADNTASTTEGIIYSSDGPRASYVPKYQPESEYRFRGPVSSSYGSSIKSVIITVVGLISGSENVDIYTSSLGAATQSFTGSDGTVSVTISTSSLPFHVVYTASQEITDTTRYDGFIVSWTGSTAAP